MKSSKLYLIDKFFLKRTSLKVIDKIYTFTDLQDTNYGIIY